MAAKRPEWQRRLKRYWTRLRAVVRKVRRWRSRQRARKPRFFTPAFQVMYILTAVSGALTWLSWRLMWYLPQAAKMDLVADTGVDPETVTVLVSQDAHAIFAGMLAQDGIQALGFRGIEFPRIQTDDQMPWPAPQRR